VQCGHVKLMTCEAVKFRSIQAARTLFRHMPAVEQVMEITRERFIEGTGREPIDDDLERANCELAGTIGHFCCGWDWVHAKPRWEYIPDMNPGICRLWSKE